MTAPSPFESELARGCSAYAMPVAGDLVLVDGSPAPDVARFVHGQLRAMVLDPRFPCVAAGSAARTGTYRFALYGEMADERSTLGLGHDLRRFVDEQPRLGDGFSTFFACFAGPATATETAFEALLWRQLERLHVLEAPTQPWHPEVGSDPDDPSFWMSLAGQAFFIVGMHAASSRWARRFAWPTLVFNARFQFRRLHESRQVGRFRAVTRQRDVRLQGDINPNLARSDERSMAREFSGRAVEDNWRCPFRPRLTPSAGGDDGEPSE